MTTIVVIIAHIFVTVAVIGYLRPFEYYVVTTVAKVAHLYLLPNYYRCGNTHYAVSTVAVIVLSLTLSVVVIVSHVTTAVPAVT